MRSAGVRRGTAVTVLVVLAAATAMRCRGQATDGARRASGYVEATEVRVAPEVGGRILEIAVRDARSRFAKDDIVERYENLYRATLG